MSYLVVNMILVDNRFFCVYENNKHKEHEMQVLFYCAVFFFFFSQSL